MITYIVEQDDVRTRIGDIGQVCDFLDRIATNEFVDVTVLIDGGKRRLSWLERLFGLSDQVVIPCFTLEKVGDVATLCFLDKNGSEFWAVDPNRPNVVSEEVRRKLAGGEPTPAPLEWCMNAARAFEAARHSLLCGTRPNWMSYQYFR